MWKDILVHCDGGEAGRRRLEYAAALAGQFQARLTGLHVIPPVEVPPVYRVGDVEAVDDRIGYSNERDAEFARANFEEITKQKSLPCRWYGTEGDIVEHLCEHSRYTDLLILGQYASAGTAEKHPLPLATSVVVRCGRPILIVPSEWAELPTETNILVAWDGSREAVRAVHDAIPLMRTAKSITVLTVSPEHDKQSLGAKETQLLLDHFQQYGLNLVPELVASDREHASIGDRLDPKRFQILVMGAYGRSRWFEFIFGGMTQSAMLSAPLPVLLSH
jgi:nucleotide-binding universal stress UspA family protein